jgi:hypothetical protein
MSTETSIDSSIKSFLTLFGIVEKNASNVDEYVKFTKKLVRDVSFFSIFPIVIGVFLGYVYSGSMINSKIYIYGFLTIFILSIIYSIYSGIQVSTNLVLLLLKVSACFIVIILIFAYMPKFSKSTIVVFNYFISTILIIIILFALGIVYYVLKNELEKLNGLSGIIVNLIFYIPCLIIDGIEYLKKELKLTPNVVFIMFILEIIFILMYFYAEKLITMLMIKNKNIVLKDPIYLNKEFRILSNDSTNHFLMNKTSFNKTYTKSGCGISKENKLINNYYSISFWVYINPTTVLRDNLNIFNYAYGKPQLVLYKNKFLAYCTNMPDIETREKTIVDAPFQKWNHFVFNYYETKCDVFVNGKLANTMDFKENIPKTDNVNDDKFILGEDNGLDGSICNVQFYSLNLSETQITRLYNTSLFKNPPLSE